MTEAQLARILGIDYGEKRIGVAMSDPLGIMAHPWGMVPQSDAGMDELRQLIEQEHVATIVVGMPFTLKGEKGPKAQEVMKFVGSLRSTFQDVECIEWDERFTTTMAQKTLQILETKRSGRSQKTGRVDAMAAALILQSFLDSTKHSRVC